MLPQDERVGISWSLRPATSEDAEWMADLKTTAMRPDLERLGYWDREWARGRFLDAYVPANTYVVLVAGAEAGLIAVRTETDRTWVEHFYLAPRLQGRGLGSSVLAHVMERHQDIRPFWLTLDRGSRARQLYEHHGFHLPARRRQRRRPTVQHRSRRWRVTVHAVNTPLRSQPSRSRSRMWIGLRHT